MKAAILRVSRGRTAWADAAVADYARRLPRALVLEEQRLEPEPFRGDVEAVRRAEAGRLLAALRPGDALVALDERGMLVGTEAFAAWIDEAARESSRRLVFAIGGPYGHGEPLRAHAWRTLSLSPMVLNHELARVLLVEQLYRAASLLWGGAYHHA